MFTKYDLTARGFLSVPCTSLTTPFKFIDQLALHLSKDDIDEVLEELPPYTDELEFELNTASKVELKRIYSILCFLSLRCDGVPLSLTPIFETTCLNLGIEPEVTQAGIILYNWHLIDRKKPFSFDNVAPNHIFTGRNEEIQGYRVLITIEGLFGRLIPHLLAIDKKLDDVEAVEELLFDVEETTVQARSLLNMDFSLPHGINLQSPVIPLIDAFLNVKHDDEEYDWDAMRANHKQCILDMRRRKRVVDYLPEESMDVYDACLSAWVSFRNEFEVSLTERLFSVHAAEERRIADERRVADEKPVVVRKRQLGSSPRPSPKSSGKPSPRPRGRPRKHVDSKFTLVNTVSTVLSGIGLLSMIVGGLWAYDMI